MSYLTKKNIADIYPLSPMQQGMLFHTLYDPKGAAYFEQFNCIIEGSLNLEHLEGAWNHLIREYPIFRTVCNWKDANQPLQIVLKERPIKLDVHDFKGLDEMAQQERINDFLATDREASFDLAKGPLMRLNVLLLDNKKYYFVWSYHHILLDGWCLSIIMQDLFKAYNALQNGERLPSLNRPPYKNYIAWLDRQDKGKAKKFWSEYLEGFDTPTPLPWDYRRPKKETLNMTEQVLTLSEDITSRLERFVRSRRTTLSTLIQSVWAILLSRYSGHDDIVYGITVSGRPPRLKGSEETVGLFINTLPVRAIIDENRSYTEFLEMFKDRSSIIMDYEYSFIPDIHACSAVSPGQSLFDSILVFENYPLEAEGFDVGSDLRVHVFTPRETTNYDVTIVGMPGKELKLRILYNQDKFEDSTIRRLMSHINNLIVNVLESPDEPIANIDMLSGQERKDLLIGFNNTNRDYPKEKCTHELFEEQVDIRPDKVALVFGDERLTYAQLNEASNKVAWYLRANGVGKGTYVAIMVERSMDMIIGVLGILKAGGAYVPIESEYPKARIKYMLEEIQAPVIIVQDRLLDRLPEYDGKILSMDQFWEKDGIKDRSNLENVNSPEDIAYVIYTSGSTGNPKGVMVPHIGITRLVKNTNYADITPDDRFLQIATFAFDAATLEFWGPLLNGGTLFLASSNDVLSPDGLADLLLSNNITIIFLTTVLFNQLVDTRPDGVTKLKRLLVGGEALSVPHVRKGIKYTKPGCFANVYGPTENTTFSTYYDVDHVPDDATSIPIGYPIANSTLYILDKYLKPVPVGVPGEIYLGGHGLAKGYLNDPEKTAKTFIPNPLSDVDEDRLYKTGDLGKWLPDGSVDFLGRIDTQVKVRGHRIELGEIESVLTDYNEIKDNVVIVKDSQGGNKLLVAYYVAEVELSINNLRSFLKERMPDYMVPNIFIRLDNLPLNPNGKVDKNALPEPEGLRPEMDTAYRAPSNDIENTIASIWQDVLGIDKIGIYDDFFDLGGHSLKATQAVTRMKEAFNVDLPIRAIFENHTIKELEDVIIELQAGETKLSSIPVLPKQDFYEVSHAQRRLWFLDKLIPNDSSYNVHGDILLEGNLNVNIITKALQIVVDRHESLRTTFSTRDDKPVQIIADYLKVELPLIDLTDKPEDKQNIYVDRVIDKEASTTFDLEEGPLFRVKIIRLAPLKHILLLTMHHVISDGWSIGIILKEAASAYFAIIKSKEPELPGLRIQYRDFAYWQNKLLEDGGLEEQKAYWLDKLGGRLPVLDLPTDRPRPPVQTSNGSVHRFSIDAGLTSRLHELSKGHDATLFMILLGAFSVLLNRLTHQEDIIIGSPIAGRNHPDLESLIGFFVNTLALRT
ncbi:MAG: amino acid adenylation domain-containing protein, partial [Deltaproteobacteria bacterium]|nr:amino acid adenylation domain-containing protein [Deltaproteobacteria bacterium]